MEGNSRNLPRNFQFGYCGSSTNPSTFIEERKLLMAKVSSCQTRQSHVSESYASQLYRNGQVNQDMKVLFVSSKKGAIPKNSITKLELKLSRK